ncbi:hypothetical protein [Arthrobacter roseus]|uniref:hypothetical protein n=1 Tax=Arthrobacter roseus TaxID=136274 RepID=UPI0019622CA7|nr:hypothetical protein [Arthrobacter roseus]MBM7848969.1 hypothetical protein [Arthrobacter roseus]
MIEKDRVGYWASRVMASFQKACKENQDSLGISDDQALVLSVLDQEGPLEHSQVEGKLSQFWRLDVVQWETAVGEMMVRGLVDFHDGKLALTELGRSINQQELEGIDLMRHDLCAGLSADEYFLTVSLLKKLARGAEEYLELKDSTSPLDALKAS